MKEINKRDIILIVAIILIVLVIAVIIIIPKNNTENTKNTQNIYEDVLANSPASPEEIMNRPVIDTPLNVELPNEIDN